MAQDWKVYPKPVNDSFYAQFNDFDKDGKPTAEYHMIDGCIKRIPIQCQTCESFVYFNGAEQLCRNQKHKGDGRFGYSHVCRGHVCDDWAWCGY